MLINSTVNRGGKKPKKELFELENHQKMQAELLMGGLFSSTCFPRK